jgi:hypothetical protein
VRQPKGNLIWITTETSASASKNDKEKFKPKLNTWDECDNVQVCIVGNIRKVFLFLFYELKLVI